MLCNIRERDRNYAACISYWHCTLVRHGKITGLCKALEHLFCNSLRQKVTVSFLNYVFQGHVENLKKKYQVLLSFKEAGTLADRHSQSCGFPYQSLSHANMKKKSQDFLVNFILASNRQQMLIDFFLDYWENSQSVMIKNLLQTKKSKKLCLPFFPDSKFYYTTNISVTKLLK